MGNMNVTGHRLNIAGVTDVGGKAAGIALKETKFPILAKIFVEIIGNIFGQRYSVVTVDHKSYLVSRDSLARFVESHKPLVQNILKSIPLPGGSTRFQVLATDIGANTKDAVNKMWGNEIEQLVTSLSVAGQGGAKLFEQEVLKDKKIDFNNIKPMSSLQEAQAAINEMFNIAEIAGFDVSGMDQKTYLQESKVNFAEFQKDLLSKPLAPNEPRAVATLQDGPKVFAQALRSAWVDNKNSLNSKITKTAQDNNKFTWDDKSKTIAGNRTQLKEMLKGLFTGVIKGDIEKTCDKVLNALEIPEKDVVTRDSTYMAATLKSELDDTDLLAISNKKYDSNTDMGKCQSALSAKLNEVQSQFKPEAKKTQRPFSQKPQTQKPSQKPTSQKPGEQISTKPSTQQAKSTPITTDELMVELVEAPTKLPTSKNIDELLSELGSSPQEQAVNLRKLAQFSSKPAGNNYVCKLLPKLPANVLAILTARDIVLTDVKLATGNSLSKNQTEKFIKALGIALESTRSDNSKKADFIKAFNECKSAYSKTKEPLKETVKIFDDTLKYMNGKLELWSDEMYPNFFSNPNEK